MFHTEYKSAEEMTYTLKNYQKIGLVVCNICSNLSDCGGKKGLELWTGLLKDWDKEVVANCLVFGCCVGSFHKYTVKKKIYPYKSHMDALVVISCAGGIKAANLYSPGLPVIAACDSFGSQPLTPRGGPHNDLVLDRVCPICLDGHCVMSYTAGICPVSECPLKCRYGYCEKPPEKGSDQCTEAQELTCIWRTIEKETAKRGGILQALREVKQMHEDKALKRMPTPDRERAANWKIKAATWTTMKLNGSIDILHAVR